MKKDKCFVECNKCGNHDVISDSDKTTYNNSTKKACKIWICKSCNRTSVEES